MLRSGWRLVLCLLASGLGVCLEAQAIPIDADGATDPHHSVWTSVEACVDASLHQVYEVGEKHSAFNPGQRWEIEFDSRGFSILPQVGGQEWGLELVRYGFRGSERFVSEPQRVRASGNRMAHDWDSNLTEWFVNDRRGVEHGFTVHQEPEGAGADESLRVWLRVRGPGRPVVLDGMRSVRFESPSQGTLLTYAGLTVFDACGRDLDARFEVCDQGLLLTVDTEGASYPITIDPVAHQAYLKASNTGAGYGFGYSVAVSGDTLVVGSPYEDSRASGIDGDQFNQTAPNSGAAYVFVRNGGLWSQQAYLKASNAELGDQFGCAVDISGNTIVVGALGESSNAKGVNKNQANNSKDSSGAVYVFKRSGTDWSQQAYIKASNTGDYDYFGYSVAVDANTLVVGAPIEASNAKGVNKNQSNDSAVYSGAAYVFLRSGETWSQTAYLKASNTDEYDSFGLNVAVSGKTVAVSSANESSNAVGINGNKNNNSAENAGAVYVFVKPGALWKQQAYIKASNTEAGDVFGTGLALHGDTLVVGATGEDSQASGVDGDQSDNSLSGAGAAYVFTRTGATWSQQSYLKASNPGQEDFFGNSASLLEDKLVVTAIYENSKSTGVNGNQESNHTDDAGAAYLFSRQGLDWSQLAYLKASNTDVGSFPHGDRFGQSVSISGNIIVVGANGEDSNATGINGYGYDNSMLHSGAAYVFDGQVLALETDVESLSLSAGGTQSLSLDAGPSKAGWSYWIFGSATGTAPGLDFGNGLLLPLNFDAYFQFTLSKPFSGIFSNYVGALDGNGAGVAINSLPAAMDPSLAGITLHHAYLATPNFPGAEFASNAMPVTLVP